MADAVFEGETPFQSGKYTTHAFTFPGKPLSPLTHRLVIKNLGDSTCREGAPRFMLNYAALKKTN